MPHAARTSSTGRAWVGWGSIVFGIVGCGGAQAEPARSNPPPADVVAVPAESETGEQPTDDPPAPPRQAEPVWAVDAYDGGPMDQLSAATRDGRVAVMVFCAKWAMPCSAQHQTLAKPEIRGAGGGFVKIDVDVTTESSVPLAAMSHFGVKTIPTVIVFNAQGDESSRHEGLTPEQRLREMVESAAVAR